jgi:hypothetical protein
MSLSKTETTRRSGVRHLSFWLRELPFGIVLILVALGVAYTSVAKQPIIVFWEVLAPLIALLCVGFGWERASGRAERFRLIWTQALHWLAFLIVMNAILLPSVQRIFNANATGLAIFTLLALGTFTGGLQVLSWQVSLLGLIMALCIPGIAWVENSALLVVLIVGIVAVVAIVFLWWRRRPHSPAQ